MATVPLKFTASPQEVQRLKAMTASGGQQNVPQGGSNAPGTARVFDIKNPSLNLPTLQSGQQVASQFGYNTDESGIRGQMDQATAAQYAANRAAAAGTENQAYREMQNNQMSYMDALRRSAAESVATGASSGINAANQLSGLLGTSQANSALATQLAQARNQQAFDEQAAYRENVNLARGEAQSAVDKAAGKAVDIYGYDAQDFAAAAQAAMGYQQGLLNLTGAKYTANKDLSGVKYAANKNLTGTKYTANKNLESTKYSVDKGKSKTGSSGTAKKSASSAGRTKKSASSSSAKTPLKRASNAMSPGDAEREGRNQQQLARDKKKSKEAAVKETMNKVADLFSGPAKKKQTAKPTPKPKEKPKESAYGISRTKHNKGMPRK